MAKYCDICGQKTGWRSFRCADGILCKECYRLASNHFSEIIAGKPLAELKKNVEENKKSLDLGEEGFRITKKVSTFLYLDEKNRKICIPGNRQVTGKYARPELFFFNDVKGFKLESEPAYTPEELASFIDDPAHTSVIKNMMIRIRLQNGSEKNIVIIPTPVRSGTYPYKKSYGIALDILRELNAVKESVQC